ncbi:MAG: peptidoglycan-binding protein [Xylanivirga thermophila]|uniref:peptidoglycan-binding domain-containing protein n=1 Tax=Xylanivirga thermophila TaxID=2496273 RepID=UPI001FB42755|nr:peptidoglycan-binding domain-containing protein [Xylanivirga thermophila]
MGDFMNSNERRILKMGSRGADVAMLQRILISIGYNPGPVDGIFGPRTRAAVIQFQLDNGLVPDGIVGPKTYAALDLVYP